MLCASRWISPYSAAVDIRDGEVITGSSSTMTNPSTSCTMASNERSPMRKLNGLISTSGADTSARTSRSNAASRRLGEGSTQHRRIIARQLCPVRADDAHPERETVEPQQGAVRLYGAGGSNRLTGAFFEAPQLVSGPTAFGRGFRAGRDVRRGAHEGLSALRGPGSTAPTIRLHAGGQAAESQWAVVTGIDARGGHCSDERMEAIANVDYLVVGAGAMGMAFVDALTAAAPDVSVAIVDRRWGAGGHWLDAYGFVRLHQASAFYGVASTLLGGGRVQADGPERGLHERASAAEVTDYYARVLARLIATGQVVFHSRSEYLGDRRFASLLSGTRSHAPRARVVDARYLSPDIPVTHASALRRRGGSPRCRGQ